MPQSTIGSRERGSLFFDQQNIKETEVTEKLGRMQVLRIVAHCGADARSVERYAENRPLRPAVEFAIRTAIEALGYRDPRPAAAEARTAVSE